MKNTVTVSNRAILQRVYDDTNNIWVTRPLIAAKYCELNPTHNPVNTQQACKVPRTDVRPQDKHTGTHLDHDFLIKGVMHILPYAGIKSGTHTITEYLPASLDWVIQHEWETLHIIGLADASDERDNTERRPYHYC